MTINSQSAYQVLTTKDDWGADGGKITRNIFILLVRLQESN